MGWNFRGLSSNAVTFAGVFMRSRTPAIFDNYPANRAL